MEGIVEVVMSRMSERLFASWDPDDPWSREHYHKLYLDAHTDAMMGKPETITVRIRPGDKLNDPT